MARATLLKCFVLNLTEDHDVKANEKLFEKSFAFNFKVPEITHDMVLNSMLVTSYEYHEKFNLKITPSTLLHTVTPDEASPRSVKELVKLLDELAKKAISCLTDAYEAKSKLMF